MTQILHSVQDDSTCPVSQILHSTKGSIQDDKRSDYIQDDRTPFLCTTPLSFIDMCAGNHQYTLSGASSMRTCPGRSNGIVQGFSSPLADIQYVEKKRTGQSP